MNLDKLRQFGNIFFRDQSYFAVQFDSMVYNFSVCSSITNSNEVFTDNGTTPIYYNHSQMSLGEKNKLHHRCTNSINILIA